MVSQVVLRVLVVDDEPAVRRGLAVWLTARQFVVQSASDLESAMAAVLDDRPDVILLDVKLGSDDGLELIKILHRASLTIPCVLLTARAGPYDGFKAHELGASDLLEKPSSPDQIVTALRNAVTVAEARTCSEASHTTDPTRGLSGGSSKVIGVLRIIQQHFRSKELSLESIARSMEVSPGHLGLIFRRETGTSVVAAIHQRRIGHAIHLLTTTTMSIKAIADECGYHDSSELHRNFNRLKGQSPLQFKRTRLAASLF